MNKSKHQWGIYAIIATTAGTMATILGVFMLTQDAGGYGIVALLMGMALVALGIVVKDMVE